MKALCERHGVTRDGFYAWVARRPSRHDRVDDQLSVRIRKVFEASDGTYGSPRIHAATLCWRSSPATFLATTAADCTRRSVTARPLTH